MFSFVVGSTAGGGSKRGKHSKADLYYRIRLNIVFKNVFIRQIHFKIIITDFRQFCVIAMISEGKFRNTKICINFVFKSSQYLLTDGTRRMPIRVRRNAMQIICDASSEKTSDENTVRKPYKLPFVIYFTNNSSKLFLFNCIIIVKGKI